MNDDAAAIDDVATRLFDAIAAGRIEDVRALYAPDAVIWHNHDGVEQTVAENLTTLGWIATHLGDVQYTQVRRRLTADGFVQQHVLMATNRRGERVAVPACIVATVRDGRITRIDEYLDRAHVERITAR